MIPRNRLSLLLLCCAFVLHCGGSSGNNGGSTEDGDEADALAAINDFAYQLQGGDDGIDLEALGATAFDLLVIDYSRDGSEDEEFSSEEIQSLKESSGGSKIVLAYMSIGEAEDYRYYFDSSWIDGDGELTAEAPDYLAPLNPDWPGNYKVRYWDAEWQSIIFGTDSGSDKSYLDRIIDAGFDGVYLDIIDAFEYFGPDGESPERDDAAGDMIDFVIALAAYARETRGISDFLVFPQNGASILDHERSDNYLEAVSGIGAEDTFYYGDEDMDNELDTDHADDVTGYLDQFIDAGKTVLAIDYLSEEDKITDFYERARDRGYVPYVSDRELDSITITDGFEPD